MDDRVEQLETKVEGLTAALRSVEARLTRLEERPAEPVPGPAASTAVMSAAETAIEAEEPGIREKDVVGVLSLIGRMFLGLAGAYLLRALTSAGYLPDVVGVAAGLAYAALWIVLADRAGAAGQRLSAAFHGATAVLLGVPLIFETTERFAILSAPASAGALFGLTALVLIVAWRRDLASNAWIVSVGAGVSALILSGRTHVPIPFTFLLVLLGVSTWWLARSRDFKGLAWWTAFLADFAVWRLDVAGSAGTGEAALADVVRLKLLLVLLYGVGFVLAAWRSESGVTAFAVVQTALALAVGYGGAMGLLRSSPGALVLGVSGLVLAAALYGLAFLGLERQRKKSSLYLTSAALVLMLVGSASLLGRPAILWAFLAFAGSLLGHRLRRLTLTFHGAVYALAACLTSGLLRQTFAAWTSGTASEVPITVDGLLALAATAACLAVPVSGDLAFWRRYAHLPKLVFLILVVVAAGGLVVRLVAPVAGADPGALATLRTAVLSAAALALAALGRLERFRESLVLVYPLLVLGAVKLLVEDFPSGHPATLFIALAFYGGALILAPRLLRSARHGL